MVATDSCQALRHRPPPDPHGTLPVFVERHSMRIHGADKEPSATATAVGRPAAQG